MPVLASKAMHTFHNSGLIHPKICIVTPAKEGKGVLVTLRKGDAPQGQIAKAAETKEFTGGKSTRQTNKAIGEMLQSYRPDRKSVSLLSRKRTLTSTRSDLVSVSHSSSLLPVLEAYLLANANQRKARRAVKEAKKARLLRPRRNRHRVCRVCDIEKIISRQQAYR